MHLTFGYAAIQAFNWRQCAALQHISATLPPCFLQAKELGNYAHPEDYAKHVIHK